MKYVLITAAYNEEKYIRGTIGSVIKQTQKPEQWVIVSDNSTDATDSIIKEYSEKYSFITYVRHINKEKIGSNLGKVSKRVVSCVNEGLKHINVDRYELLGILDSDITFGPNLYMALTEKFRGNPSLGLGGAYIYNVTGDKKWPYSTSSNNVGGALQLFRVECWEKIGGLYPGGHHDSFAILSCRMHGWGVKSFPDLEVYHHKHASVTGRSQIKAKFHLGCMDYVCGDLFIYSLIRSLSKLNKRPVLIGSLLRISGYFYAFLKRTPQQIPENLKKFQRMEQLRKILKVNRI